jgi:AcrR family transcriptional regulator
LGEGPVERRQEEGCAARRPGRPLDAAREEAILAATIELLGERGFDRFTVKDIAERAGAGLGAIYRRWPTKRDVVVAAVRLLDDHEPELALTGDSEADLAACMIAEVHRLESCAGAVLPGLVSAMRDHPDLASLLRDTAVRHHVDAYRQILGAVFDDPGERDLRAEMAVAVTLYRFLIVGQLPTHREIRDQLVPMVLGRSPEHLDGSSSRPRRRAPRPRVVNRRHL